MRITGLSLLLLALLGAAPRTGLQPGDPVPDFTVTQADGKKVKLSDLQKRSDSGIVALTFWCTTCGSCRMIDKDLDQWFQTNRANASLYAVVVNRNETLEKAAAFQKRNGFSFPSVQGTGELAALFGVTKTTTTLIFDSGRVLRYRGEFGHQGSRPAEEALQALLAGKKVPRPTTPDWG